MRLTQARPSQALPRRVETASPAAHASGPGHQAAVERAYAEITAPRADLSRLIVDTRPGHEHPLLQQEASQLRQQAHLRRPDGPRRQRPAAPARGSVEDERTAPWAPIPTALPPGHPARPARSQREDVGHTIVERTQVSPPGRPAQAPAAAASAVPRRAGDQLGERAVQLREALTSGQIVGRGQRGAEVDTLQDLLRRRGLAVPSTGVFDADTQAAVRAVQRRAGMTPTGCADLQVLRALLSWQRGRG